MGRSNVPELYFTISGLNVSQVGIWTYDGWNKRLSACDADDNLLGVVRDESLQSDQFLGLMVNSGNLAEVIVSGDAFSVDDLMMSATLGFDGNGDDDVMGRIWPSLAYPFQTMRPAQANFLNLQNVLARRCRGIDVRLGQGRPKLGYLTARQAKGKGV